MPAIYLDSFTGALVDLTRREQGDPLVVLCALSRGDGRVSTFERGAAPLERSLAALLVAGFIRRSEHEAYPWDRFFLTPAGKAAAAAWLASQRKA